MLRVLHVIPDLEYCGAATQLYWLAARMPRERFDVRVCALGSEGPVAVRLRLAGVPIKALGWTRLFDVVKLGRLRREIRSFHPDVIHAWRWTSLRFVKCAAWTSGHKIVASAVSSASCETSYCAPADRWLMRRVAAVVANSRREADQLRCMSNSRLMRRFAQPANRIIHIEPGMAVLDKPHHASKLRQKLGVNAAARMIVCIGPLKRDGGFQEAIWALEILRYLYEDLHLVIVGKGADRPRLEQFVEKASGHEQVHFLDTVEDLGECLTQAEVVWVPSRRATGAMVALEAMAAGRPVVASRLPHLAEVVEDARTGLLFPSGDKVALARQTRRLLDDSERRRQLGQAGLQRVQTHFPLAKMIDSFAKLYEDIANRAIQDEG